MTTLEQEAPARSVGSKKGGAMRITCQQEHLSRGLAIVGRAVGGRTTLPVLNNVLLASDGDRLRLAATNLELGITTWVPGRVEGEGQLTVPARLLADFVNSLPAGQQVTLEGNTRTHSLHVTSGRYTANVKGIDADEFPPIPAAEDRPTIKLGAGLLKEMIGQVAFSAAKDESRPVLAGVNLKVDESRLAMSAADGFRLALRDHELDHAMPEKLDLIVPARALTELGRLLGDNEEDVEVTVTSNRSQILFKVRGEGGDVNLVSRLLEGQFPDLERVIPKTATTKVVVKRDEFKTAIRIAALFARDAANVVRLELKPSAEGGLAPGSIEISANAAEVGDNHGQLDATVEGEETYISFSSEFLSDVLDVLPSDDVAIELTGPLSPALIRGLGLADYRHVIMPMHTVR
ncbi:MAG TPA: DNA polymerase III subunit beta [Chloroflexota bacterium]|nr:DNA polymerase III subunit beta [Chloroflexota bacterium]